MWKHALIAIYLVSQFRRAVCTARQNQAATQRMRAGDDKQLPEYFHSGPHESVHPWHATLTIQPEWAPSCGKEGCDLSLTLNAPQKTSSTLPGSWPLVLLLSGFQLPSSYYKTYARTLASWGYVVLQYDVPGTMVPGWKRVVRDDDEVRFWPALMGWVREQSRDPESIIYEVVDTRRTAVMGHSRGAKLAALTAAGGTPPGSPNPRAVILIDPVDMTSQTRRAGYPSAADALTKVPRGALLLAAGITGWCNPEDEGYRKFWPLLSPGSWLQVLPEAGHMQFTDVRGATAWALDKLCGAGRPGGVSGKAAHKVTVQWAVAASVAWLEAAFRPEEARQAQAGYEAYIREQMDAGAVNFTVKAEGARLPEASIAQRR